jgi:hypothetical protein
VTRNSSFQRKLLVSVDTVGYGRRDDQRQAASQTALLRVLDAAARAAGLHREQWWRSPAGDGELAELPDREPEPVVVDDFTRKLHAELAAHNRDLVPDARLRLRMAIHYGVTMPAENGRAGQGVVAVSRLVDSAPIKDAMARADQADLAVILSNQVFDDVIRQRHVSLAQDDFRQVTVRAKEYSATAWLHVFGPDTRWRDGPPLGAGDQASPASRASRRERPAEASATAEPPPLVQEFYGPVSTGDGAVFGVSMRGSSGREHD